MKMLRRLIKFFTGPDERDYLVKRIEYQVVEDADDAVLKALENILKKFPNEPVQEDKKKIVESLRVLITRGLGKHLQEYEDCWRMTVQPLPNKPVVVVTVYLNKSVWLDFERTDGSMETYLGSFQIGFILD